MIETTPTDPGSALDRQPGQRSRTAANRVTLADLPTVGRERVLADLMDVVKAAANGKGALYVLTGEPGVGKTRVMRELLVRARVLDCHILHGRAQEYDGSIAFAVLKDALASLRAQTLSARAQAELTTLVDAADRVVTETEPAQGCAQSPQVLTTRLLRTLSDTGPCVIVVDDAHLADSESLAALSLAIRHLRNRPILLFFAVRSGQWRPGTAFAATVGRLVDDGAGTIVQIDALDLADTKALIGTALDGRPEDRLTEHVYAQSGGNPLFARETLIALIAQDAIRSDHGRYYLAGQPTSGAVSHRGALLHRVFQQDENGRELARVMSAFKSVHLDQLSLLGEITGMRPTEVQRAFDELTDSAVLTRVEDGGFEFAHPLMAEVLYDDLGPVERRRVHAAVSAHLSSHPDRRVGILERATHAVEAASPGDSEAIDIALRAAHLTRDTAPLSSARWLERVLALLDPGSSQIGEIRAWQTRAYWKGSRPDLAVAAGVDAVKRLPNGHTRTATAVTVINAAYAMGQLTDAATLSSQVTRDDDAAVEVLAQRSLIVAHLGRPDDARLLKDSAWDRLDRSNLVEQAVTYSYLALVEVMIGTEERTTQALRVLHRLAHEDESLPVGARLSALETWAYVRSLASAPIDPDELARSAADLSQLVGWHDMGGQAVTTLARTQLFRGQWDEALETVHSGAIALEFAGLKNNLAWLRMVEVDVLLGRGLHSVAQETLDAITLSNDWSYWHILRGIQQARIDLAHREDDEPVGWLQAQLAAGAEAGWHEVIRETLQALVDVALDRDNTTALHPCAELVRKLSDGSRPAKVTRASATAAALLDEDVARARDVLAGFTFDANPLDRGRAHLVLAVLGDDTVGHLNAAATDFAALGARTWTRRTLALARRRGITVKRPKQSTPDAATSLGETELQLVQLVRDGLNNREIAEVMHYSRKTVEAYLSRLYRKTGSSSRIGLVVTAEREGWLGSAAQPSPK